MRWICARRFEFVFSLVTCVTFFGVTAAAAPPDCSSAAVTALKNSDAGRSFARAKIILIGEYHYLPWWHTRPSSPLYDMIACVHPDLRVGLEAVSYGAATDALVGLLDGTVAPERLIGRFDFPKFPCNLELLDWLKRRRIPAFGIDLDMWQSAFDTVLREYPSAVPAAFRRTSPLLQTDLVWAVPWRDDQMATQILRAHANGSAVLNIVGLNHLPSIAARLVHAGISKKDILMVFQDQGFAWADSVRAAHPDAPDLDKFELRPSNFSPLYVLGIPALGLSYRRAATIPAETFVIYDFSVAYLRLLERGMIPTLAAFRASVNTNCSGADERIDLCDILRNHLEH